jgi:hypothetical protein
VFPRLCDDSAGLLHEATVMRALGWLLLLPALLLFAWGLGLVVTADQDSEGVRGVFGWILLVSGVALITAASWTIVRARRR